MKIALYDPYLDTMSGGEKYMLSIALCLAKEHEVFILWDKTSPQTIGEQARRRFEFDLSALTFAKSPFSPKVSLKERYAETKKYDLLIVLSDGSIPIVGCPLIFTLPVTYDMGKWPNT